MPLNLLNYNQKELQEYLETHPELSEEEVTRVENQREKLLKDGLKMFDKWMNSKLFRLSAYQLKREGRAESVLCGGKEKFNVDPLEAMITATKILNCATERNIKL